ncbi:DUF1345 domain-containing protein [Embleya sp. MST-111070]|uniref:DUF1345 domain-containing protein n=1 Tax=Embleya sp. MST-111070 TaxID=3398231 RepID=UPI003F733516
MAGPRARARLRWTGSAAETLIFLSSVAFLSSTARWALIVWVVVGSLYIAGGFAAVWRGQPVEAGAVTELRALARWSWIAPLLAGTTGAVSAVTALLAKDQVVGGHRDLGLTVAASLGVILSWALMQVGFAQIYLVIDVTGGHGDLRFPEGTTPSFLSFAYFSFTLATSFATSDVEVVGVRMRRIVLVHTVIAYFYNALVVAVAFQVLQGLVSP